MGCRRLSRRRGTARRSRRSRRPGPGRRRSGRRSEPCTRRRVVTRRRRGPVSSPVATSVTTRHGPSVISRPSGRSATRARPSRAGSTGSGVRSRRGARDVPGHHPCAVAAPADLGPRAAARGDGERDVRVHDGHGPRRGIGSRPQARAGLHLDRARSRGFGARRRRGRGLGCGAEREGEGERSVGAIVSAYESQARSRSGKADVLRQVDALDPDDALPRELGREAAGGIVEEVESRDVGEVASLRTTRPRPRRREDRPSRRRAARRARTGSSRAPPGESVLASGDPPRIRTTARARFRATAESAATATASARRGDGRTPGAKTRVRR